MNRHPAILRTVILVLLVIAAVVVYAQAGYAFHDNCRDNEGRCENSPKIIVCIQPDSCRFS
jgi:hypothetical protein